MRIRKESKPVEKQTLTRHRQVQAFIGDHKIVDSYMCIFGITRPKAESTLAVEIAIATKFRSMNKPGYAI